MASPKPSTEPETNGKIHTEPTEEESVAAESKPPAVAEDGFGEGGPEDWTGFFVLDEAYISGSEDDKEPEQWDCPADRLAPRRYSLRDLNPTEKDPDCSPEWALATYWPVYVSNFRLFKGYDSDSNCTFAIHNYFASKGLPAFMVYRHKDKFFTEYQKKVGFYDMLVYFCCKKDANRAVSWCNRDLYYGHRLNVMDGRRPMYFPGTKCFGITTMSGEDHLETETDFEIMLSDFGEVRCIVKNDVVGIQVQFAKTYRMIESTHELMIIPIVGKKVQKQRFVEKDIEKELTQSIVDNPRLLRRRLKYQLLKSIMHGVIPEVNATWKRDELTDEKFAEIFKRKRGFPQKNGKKFKRSEV